MRTAPFVALLLLFAGCMVGPKYQRPEYPVPEQFRGEGPGIPTQPAEESFGNVKWFDVLKDPKLQELIRTALCENYDVRVAAQRVLAAREQVIITRADLFPQLSANAQWESTRLSTLGAFAITPQITTALNSIFGTLSWQLDFFGRIRSATEAAQADFFASDWNRKFIIQTLVSNVAQAYIQLLGLDLQLEISKSTVRVRQEYLNLARLRFDYGYDNLSTVFMAENLLYGATQVIPNLENQIEQQENQISVLIGQNPGAIERGTLSEHELEVTAPPGLPSALLERRPDILYAEQQLVAANARVGEVEALLFPQISLTGPAGWESKALSKLITTPASFWTITSSLTQPVYTGGKSHAAVRQAEAVKEQAVLEYQKAIQQAFQEVSDALVSVRKLREVREQIKKQRDALKGQTDLAYQRYFGGVTNYLEVLDSDQQLFAAELSLAQAKTNELLAVIALYQALGGGWQLDEQPAGKNGSSPVQP